MKSRELLRDIKIVATPAITMFVIIIYNQAFDNEVRSETVYFCDISETKTQTNAKIEKGTI